MCGISGIVGPDCRQDIIDKMIGALSHRGPDAASSFLSSTRQCALGHNRLSIIDLSVSGTQPMKDSTERYRIVFNGEIYNYLELRSIVGDYPYNSDSDTEVLLAGYAKFGKDLLKHLIGMFAFAIWDEKEKALFCARDRLGIKPFHYSSYKDHFYFGSEVKALLAAGIPADADWSSWEDYLKHGLYDHTERTFFKHVTALPPGHTLTLKNNAITIEPYWRLEKAIDGYFLGNIDEAADQFNALMTDSIRLRLRSDVPVGVNLSGGLDSSSLFSYVDRHNDTQDNLSCFTYAFDDPSYDEIDYAASVPRHKNWQKNISRLSADDAWDSIGRLMYHEEAPYGGIGTLAYYHLHKYIKNSGVTVVLEGQGVDELLAGYAYYVKKENVGNVYQDGTSFLKSECLSADLSCKDTPYPTFDAPFESSLSNALYRDVRYTKLPRVLRMNDRLSMAFGTELREPFLDHRVVEFCFSLPDHFKLSDGISKRLLRHAMKDALPVEVRATAKRAVVTPQREWIKGPLKNRILDLINSQSFREMGVFDFRACEKALEDFCKGHGDNAFFIWQWINFYSWTQVFHTGKANFFYKAA
jgi:asparagine synthase (glutamine-hydrolysing)